MPSFQFRISPRRAAVARFIGDVRVALQRALAEEEAKRGTTKSEVARRLGVHRSAISRRIKGTDNITLATLAEMAWAMDRDISLRLVSHETSVGANEFQTTTTQPPGLEKGSRTVTFTNQATKFQPVPR